MSKPKELLLTTAEDSLPKLREQIEFLSQLTQQGFLHLSEDDIFLLLEALKHVQEEARDGIEGAKHSLSESIERKWNGYKEAFGTRFPVGSTIDIDVNLSPSFDQDGLSLDRGEYIVRGYGNPSWIGGNMYMELLVTNPRLNRGEIRTNGLSSLSNHSLSSVVEGYIRNGKTSFILQEEDVLHFLRDKLIEAEQI